MKLYVVVQALNCNGSARKLSTCYYIWFKKELKLLDRKNQKIEIEKACLVKFSFLFFVIQV